MRTIANSFITQLLIFAAVRNRLWCSTFSKIALSHICWVLHWSETYLIRKVSFLNACLQRFGILELRNRVDLRKITSHLEFLTWNFLYKFFFRVTNPTLWNIKLNFELLSRRFSFYFSTFELLTQSWKIMFSFYFSTFELLTQSWKIISFTSSY